MSVVPLHFLPALRFAFPRRFRGAVLGSVMAALATGAGAADPAPPTQDEIRAAVTKSLPLLTNAARVSKEERDGCFTCHNQGLPIIALSIAAARGFSIDRETLRDQVQFTADFLAKNRARYLEGKGQGGEADTAGYALLALEHGGWKADATTAAVAEYLLGYQSDLLHWKSQSRRPPTEQSLFTSTHVALRGLKTFGTAEQQERIQQRTDRVREWLLKTPAEDTEDAVGRLRALRVAGAAPHEIGNAVQVLLQSQGADGGWSQLADQESDVYATGSVLAALHQAGDLPVNDRTYVRGLRYLLAAQLPDGSWHVKTRSKPIQTYYEGGYPHGKDQFISSSAASWATIALALAVE
jgi:N-acyl-D-amino-acid deacylase